MTGDNVLIHALEAMFPGIATEPFMLK